MTVARLPELAADGVSAVRCDGSMLALVCTGGDIYALKNTCPHRGGPLAAGKLVAGELACPWHGFRFDPKSGAATIPTPHPPATSVPVRIAGDDVQVLID